MFLTLLFYFYFAVFYPLAAAICVLVHLHDNCVQYRKMPLFRSKNLPPVPRGRENRSKSLCVQGPLLPDAFPKRPTVLDDPKLALFERRQSYIRLDYLFYFIACSSERLLSLFLKRMSQAQSICRQVTFDNEQLSLLPVVSPGYLVRLSISIP